MTCVKEILSKKALFNQVAKQTFDAVDSDGSQQISEDELYIILCSICTDVGFERPTEDDTKEILKMIDVDDSGSISFKEFKKLFKKLLKIVNEN